MPVGTLVINEYGKDTRECRIADAALRIGRDPRADIVLGDRAVSRYHARILRQGEAFLIEDLGSSNGTFVNEKKIPERSARSLSHGDRVRIGRSILRFILQVTSRFAGSSADMPSPADQETEETTGDRGSALCLFRLEKIEAVLLVATKDAVPERHVLGADRLRIGSDSASDVVLSDPSVSKKHAEIVYNREGFHLVDRDSTTGTFLDGVSITLARLQHRSYIKFGRQKALFLIHEAGKDPPEVSFGLRDHLMELYPEKEALIQQAFKACRERGRDMAEELVARGVLDPEEWCIAARDFKEQPSSRIPALGRALGRFFSHKKKRSS